MAFFFGDIYSVDPFNIIIEISVLQAVKYLKEGDTVFLDVTLKLRSEMEIQGVYFIASDVGQFNCIESLCQPACPLTVAVLSEKMKDIPHSY